MIPTFLRRTAAVVTAATAVALVTTFSTPASGAPSDDPRVLAVRFELVPAEEGNDDGPLSPAGMDEQTHYAEFQVDHGGVTRRLRPAASAITVTPTAGSSAISVEIDGLRTGPAADDFESTMDRALGSASVGSFVRVDTGGVGGPAVLDISLGRRLQDGDYLLVQEAGGDATLDIEAVGAFGATIGAPLSVGPPYRWNSGRLGTDGDNLLASVIEVSPWAARGDVAGLRLRTERAELKVLLLETATGAIPISPPSPAPTVTMTPIPIPTPTSTPSAAGAEARTTEIESPPPTTAPPAQPVEQPPAEASSNPATRVLAQADSPAPMALAMTGVSTDPWVLVALATGLIFFGYTAVVAFKRPAHRPEPGEPAGHAQLDALGFD